MRVSLAGVLLVSPLEFKPKFPSCARSLDWKVKELTWTLIPRKLLPRSMKWQEVVVGHSFPIHSRVHISKLQWSTGTVSYLTTLPYRLPFLVLGWRVILFFGSQCWSMEACALLMRSGMMPVLFSRMVVGLKNGQLALKLFLETAFFGSHLLDPQVPVSVQGRPHVSLTAGALILVKIRSPLVQIVWRSFAVGWMLACQFVPNLWSQWVDLLMTVLCPPLHVFRSHSKLLFLVAIAGLRHKELGCKSMMTFGRSWLSRIKSALCRFLMVFSYIRPLLRLCFIAVLAIKLSSLGFT